MPLPALLPRNEIQQRLRLIFPQGAPQRGYCTRELAASTVFAALYIGALEGSNVYFAPKHVYRMTDRQAGRVDVESRRGYADNIRKPGFEAKGRRWYRDNTREPIRDETLREGFVSVGAVVEKTGIPTTSSKPRYALAAGFAALFDPDITGDALAAHIAAWQERALSKGALARIALVRKGASPSGDHVIVNFPNGETRRMTIGPSSQITKAVIEVFAPRYLRKPAVLYVSESGNKVVARDDELARRLVLRSTLPRICPTRSSSISVLKLRSWFLSRLSRRMARSTSGANGLLRRWRPKPGIRSTTLLL